MGAGADRKHRPFLPPPAATRLLPEAKIARDKKWQNRKKGKLCGELAKGWRLLLLAYPPPPLPPPPIPCFLLRSQTCWLCGQDARYRSVHSGLVSVWEAIFRLSISSAWFFCAGQARRPWWFGSMCQRQAGPFPVDWLYLCMTWHEPGRLGHLTRSWWYGPGFICIWHDMNLLDSGLSQRLSGLASSTRTRHDMNLVGSVITQGLGGLASPTGTRHDMNLVERLPLPVQDITWTWWAKSSHKVLVDLV